MDAVVIGEKDSHGGSFRTGLAARRAASCGKTIRGTLSEVPRKALRRLLRQGS
jgi:hypothetical protein